MWSDSLIMKNLVIGLLSLTTVSILTIPSLAEQAIRQDSESSIDPKRNKEGGVELSQQFYRISSEKLTQKASHCSIVPSNFQDTLQGDKDSHFRKSTIQCNKRISESKKKH